MVIKDVLNNAKKMLIDNNIDSREARLLLAYSMGISSNDLIKYDLCTDEQFKMFMECISRRINKEPFAYIVRI